MGESGRHVHQAVVFHRDLNRLPSTLRGGSRPKVDDDVVNRPLCTPDQLGLFKRCRLVVKTAERSAPRIEGEIAFGQVVLQAMSRQIVAAPAAREEAAFIADRLDLDQKGTLQPELGKPHATRTSGTGMMKPPSIDVRVAFSAPTRAPKSR